MSNRQQRHNEKAYLINERVYTVGGDRLRQLHEQQDEDLQARQGSWGLRHLPLRRRQESGLLIGLLEGIILYAVHPRVAEERGLRGTGAKAIFCPARPQTLSPGARVVETSAEVEVFLSFLMLICGNIWKRGIDD